jgi:hypothetical protein
MPDATAADSEYYDPIYWRDKYWGLKEQPAVPVSALRALADEIMDHPVDRPGPLRLDIVQKIDALCDAAEKKP